MQYIVLQVNTDIIGSKVYYDNTKIDYEFVKNINDVFSNIENRKLFENVYIKTSDILLVSDYYIYIPFDELANVKLCLLIDFFDLNIDEINDIDGILNEIKYEIKL